MLLSETAAYSLPQKASWGGRYEYGINWSITLSQVSGQTINDPGGTTSAFD